MKSIKFRLSVLNELIVLLAKNDDRKKSEVIYVCMEKNKRPRRVDSQLLTDNGKRMAVSLCLLSSGQRAAAK